MSEIERVLATIARIEAKRDAATDDESKNYYRLCLRGWRAWLAKLEQGCAEVPTPASASVVVS